MSSWWRIGWRRGGHEGFCAAGGGAAGIPLPIGATYYDGRSLQPLREAEESALVQRHSHLAGVAGQDSVVVAWRGEEAGDDQLPDLQAGAGRALLRQDLRADEGLRVQLREVQAHAPSWRGV